MTTVTTPTNNTIDAANGIDKSTKSQSAQGVQLQTYCNSVLAQPTVDLSADKNLVKFQDQINNGIGGAKTHANEYLNTIQPLIITNVANIANYYGLHQAVATSLPVGSSKSEWVNSLNLLKDQSTQFLSDSQSVASQLKTLNTNIGADAGNFTTIVSNLNAAVNGDNGVLHSLDQDLSAIQSKIDGAIAGAALSGVAIAGGIFLAAVGGIADFVTAGTSTPLVILGAGLIVAGVGGEVGSAIAIKNLTDQKTQLLQEQASLTSEVKLALGMSNGYSALGSQAQAAMQAATQMSNAWDFLSGDLSSLITDIQKGILSTDQLRKIFLTAANSVIQNVIADTNIIKQQMAGVSINPVPQGQTVGNYLVSLAQRYSN